MELPSTFLSPSSKNIKKSNPKKIVFREWNFLPPRLRNSLYFGKLNFLALILRNFLHFLKRKLQKMELLYILGNRNPQKFLIFKETELVYISENGNSQKNSYISGNGTLKNSVYFRRELLSSKNKNKKTLLLWSFLYFRKSIFLAPSLKNIFQERICKAWKSN